MSQGSVLFRFQLDVSDVDRSFYDKLDFRLAQHASESLPFLLTRMLAYSLNVEEGLLFSPKGLAEPNDPCLSSDDPRGGKKLWIEVGSPSVRRLHKASKASKKVKVYTYKNPENLLREVEGEKIHKGDQIEIYSLNPALLESLAAVLERDNTWSIYRDQDSLLVTVGEETFASEIRRI